MNDSSTIETLHRRGRDALGFELNLAAFAPAARRALRTGSAPESIHAEDLYLASACALGDSKAIAHFEKQYAEVLRRIAHRAQLAGVNADDLLQHLRIRLFVGGGAAIESDSASIASYVGTGPLTAWLRVVAARLATELIARDARGRPLAQATEASWSALAASDNPELATMRVELKQPLQAAVKMAIAALTAQDRALLRQYYVHKVGVDGIGKLLGVHRSNASRAVARARGHFLREVKQVLGVTLGLSDNSLDSAFGLMRSDLSLSLGSLL